MTNTNLVGGTWATNGAPLVPGSGSIPFNGGNYWYVCNRTGANGSDGNEGTADMPFATLDWAIGKCVADQGDVIVILSGHAETISAAAGIACDVAGITIIGEGNGSDRPTFTFSTSTAATMTVSAANITIANIVGVCGIDVLVSPWVVSAAGCTLGLPGAPIEWQDPDSSHQAIRQILTTTAANKLSVNLKTVGVLSGGTAPVNGIRLVGCDSGIFTLDFYGRASTAVVEFFTGAASTNIEVYGYMYNASNSASSYAKDIVDTVTGSTWFASISDGWVGYDLSGGSGSALGPAQAATVIADLAVATADATTNALERDVIGNKTDAAVTAVGTTKSIEAYVKGLVTMSTVQSADSTNNAFAGDVVGNKTDAAQVTVGTTRSTIAYVKGLMNSTERTIVKTDGNVLTGADALFTVTGGPIKIVSIVGRVTTIVGGVANGTLQATTTVPASTTAMSTTVAIDNLAAGAVITFVGPTGVLTKTTAGVVLMDYGSTTLTPTQYIVNAGTIEFLGSAAQSGVIEWTMDYLPMNPSVVVAAAA